MVDHGVNTMFNDSKKINLLKPRNDNVRKSCLYMGTSIWNTLNLDLRDSNIKDFKKNISTNIMLPGLNFKSSLNTSFSQIGQIEF